MLTRDGLATWRRFLIALAVAPFLASCTSKPESEAPPAIPTPAPPPERPDPFGSARQRMVERLRQSHGITDERLLEAMARVPRHEFVPPTFRHAAYNVQDALPIAENQTISSPEIVAVMTAALKLQGDEKVLEIGTGSGYQAAILGELVPRVYTVEIRPGLAETARKRLADLKQREILRYEMIDVIAGDGYQGYEPEEPYDAIIVTAAPSEVPVKLLNQLKVGGRMVIPVGSFYQKLQLIRRTAEGYDEKFILPVRFVPMVHETEAQGER